MRPGLLTDERGTGKVLIADKVERGEIPRDDVAAVLLAVLGADNTVGKTFELRARRHADRRGGRLRVMRHALRHGHR